ncbi:calponin homology domain-containing protein DDB_G0272472-like [Palaemon carinicauda]|uniref:calponin homology domain-containing protein DDB_G0272472-like n=1 Tax=Palaemon carinicauda TaxID=392227 RepID=UPI0035B63E02
MEAEALTFNDQLRTRWFVGKLLREFNVGGVEEILSRGNKNIYYLGLAAAGAIFGGIMLATRRMTKEGEGVPELKTEEVTQEKLIAQKETEIQKLKIDGAEKDLKMKEQKEQETIRKEKEDIKKILNEKIKQVEIDCVQKDLKMKEQEKELETIRKEKEDIKKTLNEKIKRLENDCIQKDLKMKEQEKEQETIRKEKEDFKKILNEKIKQLENDCVQEDLKMKEQEKLLKNLKTEKEIINKVQNEKSELQNECIEKEKLLGILKNENEALKKVQNQKTELLKQLVNEVVELKRENDEQEKLEAKMVSDYQNLGKAYNDKDLQMKELKKLLAEKEKLESEYENLKKECAEKDDQLKRQERLLEILKYGNKGPKKFQKDHIIIWKNKVDELNAEKEEQEKLNAKMASDYQNLLKECAKKDLEMKKQERLLEILKTENEATQAQKEQLRNEVNKLKAEKQVKENMKAEKQAKENMKAEKTSDQEKEKESVKRDFKGNEETKNEENKNECNMETENKMEDKWGKLLKDGLLAHENKRFDEAMAMFTDALAIDLDNKEQTALLHILRAEANAASGNPQDMDIVLDCCQAVDNGLQRCRAYMLRGKHLLKLGLFDAALNDFKASRKVEGSKECLKFIEDTKALKKKWESQSHYEVLGVGSTCPESWDNEWAKLKGSSGWTMEDGEKKECFSMDISFDAGGTSPASEENAVSRIYT